MTKAGGGSPRRPPPLQLQERPIAVTPVCAAIYGDRADRTYQDPDTGISQPWRYYQHRFPRRKCMHAQAAPTSESGRGADRAALVRRFARAARKAQPISAARTARLLLLRLRQNDGTEALPEVVRTAEIRRSMVGYVMPHAHADAKVHTSAGARARKACVSHQPTLPLSASAESSSSETGDAERRRTVDRHGARPRRLRLEKTTTKTAGTASRISDGC